MLTNAEKEYGLTGVPEYANGILHFRISYHSVGEARLYKLGKKIYKKYGFLPMEQANESV